MRPRTWLILILLLAVTAAIVAFLIYSPLRDITTAPRENSPHKSELAAEDSIIALPIRIAFTDLAALANRKIPEILVDRKEKKKYKTRLLGIRIKIKGELKSFVKRTGPAQVSRHKDQLELRVPLYFQARFKGNDSTDPDASTQGKVDLFLRLQPGMTPQWQPTLKARADYRWINKPKLQVGLLSLDAEEILGDELEKWLDNLCRDLEKDVAKSADLRQKAARRWYEFHQVRQLGDDRIPAWLMVDPKAAYFAPPRLTHDALLLQFAITARLTTLLGNAEPPPEAEPLPDLIIELPPANGFKLQLPVLLDYKGMTRALRRRYKGHKISLPQGEIELLDFKLYTAGAHLVLGTNINAHAPGRLFNTLGWLYLKGIPAYDASTRQLVVQDFSFTRQVDNPLISGASWVLQDSLRDQLAEAVSYDLSEKIEDARRKLEKRINRPLGDGLVMSGTLSELGITEIQPRKSNLLLLLNASGRVAIESSLSLPETATEAGAGE